MRRSATGAAWAAAALVTLVAGALRLAHLGQVVGDPFYDAAVRSMGLSWHNFFFGAVEPSGAVAIDKPPVDLWLQVASVKVLGFHSAALKLPEALAGTLAVAALFEAVRRVFGVRAAVAAGLALAVLPIAVITARSDTMDAVMMALTVLALLAVVRAAETGRTVWLAAAAVALGLAFNVKLLESLVALPGLVLLAWLGLPGNRRRRAGQLAVGGLVCVAVSLSWLTATLLYPAHDRPYAYGSTNGSAWDAAFIYNGLDRLEGKAVEGPQTGFLPGYPYPERTQSQRDQIPIVPSSPTRLLARIGPLSGERLGLEALAGLLLGGALLGALLRERIATRRRDEPADGHDPPPASRARPDPPAGDRDPADPTARSRLTADGRPADRLQLATIAGLMLWLVSGIALFSYMGRLHPRYTEAFTPAVAATLGIGVAWATARPTRGRLAALTVTLVAITAYAEPLLFGTTAVWGIVAVAALGSLVLAWAAKANSVKPAGAPKAPADSSLDRPALAPTLRHGDLLSAGALALALVCLLAIPLWASLRAVRENVSDTNRLGVLRPAELGPLSAYLRAHQGTAYYEAAFDSGTKMGALVERDARPILVLTTLEGRVFTPVARLAALAAAGKVRYAFLGTVCGPHTPRTDAGCSAPARWVRAHGRDVSAQAGLPRGGVLWKLP
jgi:4-amino-4-deoxy-L-arabinose transferase-like glycosyltransferase